MAFVEKKFSREQLKILKSCLIGAPLAADIAHAHVNVYVPDSDDANIFVYTQAQPLNNFVSHLPLLAKRSLRKVEEPLVTRSMQRGIVVTGKREWVLGNFATIKIFPLFDSRRVCFGVVAFEINAEHEGNTDDVFMNTAMRFLCGANVDRLGRDEVYRRLTPSDGVMIVNRDFVITAANNTAKHIFFVLGVADLVGRRTNSVQINWPLVGMVLKTGTAESKEITMQGLSLAIRILPVRALPEAETAIIILNDVTELRKKDEELLIKSAVIKEIHHRVKNNLQTIASLLRLQARRAHSQETKTILRDCINRVNSIAIVHDHLAKEDGGLINVGAVAREIYRAILAGMLLPDLHLETSIEADNVSLPSEEANSIALTLNELLQNALEHAFSGRKTGSLKVTFKVLPNRYVLEITDDGVGLPPDFVVEQSDSLGLKIVQTMIESDLGGTLELLRLNRGTCARAVVPVRKEKKKWKN